MSNPLEIRSPDGRLWGTVEGLTYTTYRNQSHFVRRHNGWGIQIDVYCQLNQMGVQTIIIKLPHNLELHSRMEDWRNHGITDMLRRSDGEQRFLESLYFSEQSNAHLRNSDYKRGNEQKAVI